MIYKLRSLSQNRPDLHLLLPHPPRPHNKPKSSILDVIGALRPPLRPVLWVLSLTIGAFLDFQVGLLPCGLGLKEIFSMTGFSGEPSLVRPEDCLPHTRQ